MGDASLPDASVLMDDPFDSDRRSRLQETPAEGYIETSTRECDPEFEKRRELLAVARLKPLVWFSEWTRMFLTTSNGSE